MSGTHLLRGGRQLQGEARVHIPRVVQPTNERLKQGLLRDGEQPHGAPLGVIMAFETREMAQDL